MFVPMILKQRKVQQAIVVGHDDRTFEFVKKLSENGFLVMLLLDQEVPEETIRKSGILECTYSIKPLDEEKVLKEKSIDISLAMMTDDPALNERLLKKFHQIRGFKYSVTPTEYSDVILPSLADCGHFQLCLEKIGHKGDMVPLEIPDQVQEKLKDLDGKVEAINKFRCEVQRNPEELERVEDVFPDLLEMDREELEVMVEGIAQRNEKSITVGFVEECNIDSLKAQRFVDELEKENPSYEFNIKRFDFETNPHYQQFFWPYNVLRCALLKGEIDIAYIESVQNDDLTNNLIQIWRNVLPRSELGYIYLAFGQFRDINEVFRAKRRLLYFTSFKEDLVEDYLTCIYEDNSETKALVEKLYFRLSHESLEDIVMNPESALHEQDFLLVSKEELRLNGFSEEFLKKKGFSVIPTNFYGTYGAGRYTALTLKNNVEVNKLLSNLNPSEPDNETERLERLFFKLAIRDYYWDILYVFALSKGGKYKLIYNWYPAWKDKRSWGETEWLPEEELIRVMGKITKDPNGFQPKLPLESIVNWDIQEEPVQFLLWDLEGKKVTIAGVGEDAFKLATQIRSLGAKVCLYYDDYFLKVEFDRLMEKYNFKWSEVFVRSSINPFNYDWKYQANADMVIVDTKDSYRNNQFLAACQSDVTISAFRVSFTPSPFANAVLPPFIESNGNYLCAVTTDEARDLERKILATIAEVSPELTGEEPQIWMDY